MLLWAFYSLTHFWNDHKFQSPRLLSPFHTCACVDTHKLLHMLSSGIYKSLASGLKSDERLMAPFSTVFLSQFQRDGHKHIKKPKNIKMLELIPCGLFRWHQIPTYSQRDIWVQPEVQFRIHAPESMELFTLIYSVHGFSRFSQQSWARNNSRIIEVLRILSGSNSSSVGSIVTSTVTCPPQQLWGRADCSQQRCWTMGCPQALGMGCRAEFWFWVKVALLENFGSSCFRRFLGTIKRTNQSRGHTVLVGNSALWVH